MKKLMSILFTSMIITAAFAQEPTVRSISNISPGEEYESYAFMDDMNQRAMAGESTSDQMNNMQKQSQSARSLDGNRSGWATLFPMENSMIREAINYEFDVAGLEKTNDNPDLLIQYHIYNKDYAKEDSYIQASEDYEYSYPKKADLMSNIENGTLVVSVINNETDESIWEGFAFNSYDEGASLDDKRESLRQSVDALVAQFLADNEDEQGVGDGISR